MTRSVGAAVVVASLVTLGGLLAWIATDRHTFTKFEVVEWVEAPLPDDDPFREAGLYDGGVRRSVERRPEFHLGLLPAPRGLLDRHVLSVATFAVPAWLLALALAWRARRA